MQVHDRVALEHSIRLSQHGRPQQGCSESQAFATDGAPGRSASCWIALWPMRGPALPVAGWQAPRPVVVVGLLPAAADASSLPWRAQRQPFEAAS
jgi:hypothetical protein